MDNDPVHAKRIEDNLNRRNEFADPETTVAVPSEGRTDATKRDRQDELETPQESANTGGASSSSAGADVDMRVKHTLANDRWIQAATKTWCADWTYLTSLTSLTKTVSPTRTRTIVKAITLTK